MAERKPRAAAKQWFDFPRDSYLERTSRPIYALVFLLPFIIFYELGTIFINTDVLSQTQVRVVAFVWVQNLLGNLGFSGKFLWAAPAVVLVIILLAYQLVSGKQWWISFKDMLPMAIECILLAVPLIVLSLLLHTPTAPKETVAVDIPVLVQCASEQSAAAQQGPTLFADIVTGVGAGIYEELLFRLALICALMLLLQDVLGWSRNNSIVLAVLVSAALFAAHHHIDFLSGLPNQSDPFDWAKFIFRTLAGVYFAALFAIRGFGITAGTHAFYDIIATLITAIVFGK